MSVGCQNVTAWQSDPRFLALSTSKGIREINVESTLRFRMRADDSGTLVVSIFLSVEFILRLTDFRNQIFRTGKDVCTATMPRKPESRPRTTHTRSLRRLCASGSYWVCDEFHIACTQYPTRRIHPARASPTHRHPSVTGSCLLLGSWCHADVLSALSGACPTPFMETSLYKDFVDVAGALVPFA